MTSTALPTVAAAQPPRRHERFGELTQLTDEQGAIEHQQLTANMVEVVVKSKTAPVALATCELMGRRCSDRTLAPHRISGEVPGQKDASTS